MLPRYCVPQRQGDEGSCPSASTLQRCSYPGVWAQLLQVVLLLHLVRPAYVGMHFLVLVKTALILPPTQTLKLPLGASEMAQWVKGWHEDPSSDPQPPCKSQAQ